jgi:proline dehydrogenase
MIDINCSIIAAVADLDPKGYISVKAPDFDYDPQVLTKIAAMAIKHNTLIHFDSHDISQASREQACARQIQALGAAVSLSIPGCWLRGEADAVQCAELGMRIRVVKGLWADPKAPDIDMREGYLKIIDAIAGKAPEVAIATHDPWLARESLKRLQAAGTPCELELLYGLPSRPIYALAKEYAVPVRVYIPFGFAWQPYMAGKFLKNPLIAVWVARDFIAGLISLVTTPKSDSK